jgi:FkbM family methyltransferase
MKFYSQNGQDKYLYNNHFKNKKNGFFVEVGADDGIDKSNTYFFENIGWNGICIEPSPVRFKELEKNRQCVLVNKPIADEKKQVEFLDISGWGKGFSGIIDSFHRKHQSRINKLENNPKYKGKKVVTLETIPLKEIFEQANVTKVDYCSIDVEGGELAVLKSIDFDKVDIYCFSLENNFNDQEPIEYLKSKGYKQVKQVGADLIFVKK